jgi:parvulin-like peptidyl-prolyl isomerase
MGDEIKASHILLKLGMDANDSLAAPVKAKADSLYAVLSKGDVKFDEVAKTVSEDATTAQNGGDLGYFGWGRMVDEFQEAAFKLKPGEMSQPIKTSYGYHIIKVIDRRPNPNRKSFDEEKENIVMSLRRKYQTQLGKEVEEYIKKLKEEQQLKFNYANIQKILDKVNDPASPHNNSLFSDFTGDEKKWEVASMKGRTLTVAEMEQEMSKMGNMPQRWRDQKEVEGAVDRMLLPKFLGDRAKEKGLLNAKTVEEAYKNALESRMIQMVEAKQVEDKINAGDPILLSYYQTHLNEFMTDSTAMVQEIYIMVDPAKDRDLPFAQNIANRAKKGESFVSLVKKYTDRKSTIDNKGKIGPLTSRQYGEMGKMAFHLNVGQVSDPIPMGSRAYSIIKVLEKTDPHQKPFEEAKPMVERQIRVAQSDSLRKAWIADMEKRYPSNVNEQALTSAFPMKAEASDQGKAAQPKPAPGQPGVQPQGHPQQAAQQPGGK